MPSVTQAVVAARACCFVSKRLLLPKGAVSRKEREDTAPLLIKPIHLPFQVLGPETDRTSEW